MSRHRIVRTMDYKDEYEGYDDVYGHSVDDDNCISPTDASQWIYDRARGQQSISAFMANHRNIEEEDEEADNIADYPKTRRDSENFQMPVLDDLEQAKLMSCIDEVRSVVGDTVSEKQIVEAVMKYNYDVPKALDAVLNSTSTPPQEKCPGKILKEPPVEKDSKSKLLKIANSDKTDLTKTIKVPVLNLSGNNNDSNRLNELITSNLQNCKLNDSPSKLGFVLPKLNIPSTSSRSSKLNQFINSQLNKAGCGGTTPYGGFTIPKLGGSLKENNDVNKTVLTPLEMSLKKIREAKQGKKNDSRDAEEGNVLVENLTQQKDDSWVIDLSDALSNVNVFQQEIRNIVPKEEEKFVIPFIDCDLRFSLSSTENVLENERENLIYLKKFPSNFGKVMCLKYRCKMVPYIKHAFSPKHSPVQFKFESKSPDDIILEHLNKAKQKI